MSEALKGVVAKSTGSWFLVRKDGSKSYINCKIKGKFRIEGIKSTNPVCVGDHVIFSLLPDNETGIITDIEERHNYIIRKATKLSKQSHIIAANIDQAILIATMINPRTSTGFIDRFLVTAEAYHIPSVIIFNKLDLYDQEVLQKLNKIIKVYTDVGYQCLTVSALRGDNVKDVKEVMKDQVSLVVGHSGVGKSELINTVDLALKLKTGDISRYHNKGKHTTTFAEMFELSFGGFIIDTPGLKEFGLIYLEKEEIWERFPEMRGLSPRCRFYNCTHVHEPGCAVKEALERGDISDFRYKNYLNILEEDEFRRK